MLAYWLIFSFCCISLFFSENVKYQRYLAAVIGFILIIFIGTRAQIGLDVRTYDEFFDYIIVSSFFDGLQRIEFGFVILSLGMNALGVGYSGVNLVLAAFLICGLFYYIDYFKCYKFAWLSLFPVGLVIAGMGFGRQAGAVGCVACMFVFLQNSEHRKASIAFIVATLLHYGSMLLFPIIIAQMLKNFLDTGADKIFRNVMLLLFFAVVSCLLISYSSFFDIHIFPKIDYYLSNFYFSAGFWYRWTLIAIPALSILFMNRQDSFKNYLFDLNVQISLSVFLIAPVGVYFSTFADRVLLFFLPIVPLGYFYLFKMFEYHFDRKIALSLINLFAIAYFGIAFYVWASFSKFSGYWFPYKSYVFNYIDYL